MLLRRLPPPAAMAPRRTLVTAMFTALLPLPKLPPSAARKAKPLTMMIMMPRLFRPASSSGLRLCGLRCRHTGSCPAPSSVSPSRTSAAPAH